MPVSQHVLRAVPAGEAVRRVAARIGVSGAVLALTYLCMLVTALIPAPVAFLVGMVISYVAEWSLYRRSWLPRVLGSHRLPVAQRFVLREAFALVLLLRVAADAVGPIAAVTGGIILIQLLRGLYNGLQHRLREWRGCRYAWRNLPTDDLPDEWPRISPPGLSLFRGDAVRTMMHADLPIIIGIALVPLGLSTTALPVLAAVAALLAIVVPARLALQVPTLRRLPNEEEVARRLRGAVERLAPEVCVYFSSPRGSTYQVNVWIPTLNRRRRPTLIILGESHHLDALTETDVPIVVLPRAEDVSLMHVPSLRVALFPTNVIKNNQMLRLVGIRSAFIGHGDSDKAGSFNPLSRVYDEIWVAGEAGRARYARTREGIRPEQVKLVGRPQLTDIDQARTAGAVTPGDLTVLYAPTWEGFFEASDYSSVVVMGEEIVRRLLAMERPVRVLFKGHPATGTRVRAYREAVSRIEELVTRAGNGSAVVEDTVGLYTAFNEADMLVTDISSVANDFLYSAKPLVVTNPSGRDDAAFVAEFPLTEAAHRIGPDCGGLEDAVRQAVEADALREARLRMRTYLLGDAEGDPVERFLDEIDQMVERNHYRLPPTGLQRLALLSEERAGGFATEDLASDTAAPAEVPTDEPAVEAAVTDADAGVGNGNAGATEEDRSSVPAEGEW